MHSFITLSTLRHMINEIFMIESDKNDQILALDFGCLEIFVFFLQNLVGWLIYVCSSQQ